MSVLSKKGLRSALLATFAVLVACGGVPAEQETLGTKTQSLDPAPPEIYCPYLNEAQCLADPGCTAKYIVSCAPCAPGSLCGPCMKSFESCEAAPQPPPPPLQHCFSNAECPVNQYCAVDPNAPVGGCPPCEPGDGPCPLCALPPPGVCTQVPTCVPSPVDAGTPGTPGNDGGSGTPTNPAP